MSSSHDPDADDDYPFDGDNAVAVVTSSTVSSPSLSSASTLNAQLNQNRVSYHTTHINITTAPPPAPSNTASSNHGSLEPRLPALKSASDELDPSALLALSSCAPAVASAPPSDPTLRSLHNSALSTVHHLANSFTTIASVLSREQDLTARNNENADRKLTALQSELSASTMAQKEMAGIIFALLQKHKEEQELANRRIFFLHERVKELTQEKEKRQMKAEQRKDKEVEKVAKELFASPFATQPSVTGEGNNQTDLFLRLSSEIQSLHSTPFVSGRTTPTHGGGGAHNVTATRPPSSSRRSTNTMFATAKASFSPSSSSALASPTSSPIPSLESPTYVDPAASASLAFLSPVAAGDVLTQLAQIQIDLAEIKADRERERERELEHDHERDSERTTEMEKQREPQSEVPMIQIDDPDTVHPSHPASSSTSPAVLSPKRLSARNSRPSSSVGMNVAPNSQKETIPATVSARSSRPASSLGINLALTHQKETILTALSRAQSAQRTFVSESGENLRSAIRRELRNMGINPSSLLIHAGEKGVAKGQEKENVSIKDIQKAIASNTTSPTNATTVTIPTTTTTPPSVPAPDLTELYEVLRSAQSASDTAVQSASEAKQALADLEALREREKEEQKKETGAIQDLAEALFSDDSSAGPSGFSSPTSSHAGSVFSMFSSPRHLGSPTPSSFLGSINPKKLLEKLREHDRLLLSLDSAIQGLKNHLSDIQRTLNGIKETTMQNQSSHSSDIGSILSQFNALSRQFQGQQQLLDGRLSSYKEEFDAALSAALGTVGEIERKLDRKADVTLVLDKVSRSEYLTSIAKMKKQNDDLLSRSVHREDFKVSLEAMRDSFTEDSRERFGSIVKLGNQIAALISTVENKASKSDLLELAEALDRMPKVHEEVIVLKGFIQKELDTRTEEIMDVAIDRTQLKRSLQRLLRSLQDEVQAATSSGVCNACAQRTGAGGGTSCLSCAQQLKLHARLATISGSAHGVSVNETPLANRNEILASRGGGFMVTASMAASHSSSHTSIAPTPVAGAPSSYGSSPPATAIGSRRAFANTVNASQLASHASDAVSTGHWKQGTNMIRRPINSAAASLYGSTGNQSGESSRSFSRTAVLQTLPPQTPNAPVSPDSTSTTPFPSIGPLPVTPSSATTPLGASAAPLRNTATEVVGSDGRIYSTRGSRTHRLVSMGKKNRGHTEGGTGGGEEWPKEQHTGGREEKDGAELLQPKGSQSARVKGGKH